MMRSEDERDSAAAEGARDVGDQWLGEWLDVLREDVAAPAELRVHVMSRVRALPAPLWRRAVDWLLTPRTLRITPAAGGLAVAALAAAVTLWPGSQRTPEPEGPVANGEPAAVGERPPTRFVFVAPASSEVSSVRITGDFVAWDPEGIALEDLRGTGVWTVDVPLRPGVYQYTFIVNGTEWRPDPRAISQVDDGFGQLNSVLIVPGGGDA
jgi:hypothetical protein